MKKAAVIVAHPDDESLWCGGLPIAEPVDADPQLFEAVVQSAKVPVLVDFWASWCGPCRVAAPGVKQVAAEMAGKAIVLKIDTERHPDLANRYGVRGIPHFAVIRNGKTVKEHSGLVDANQMRAWLQQAAQ